MMQFTCSTKAAAVALPAGGSADAVRPAPSLDDLLPEAAADIDHEADAPTMFGV